MKASTDLDVPLPPGPRTLEAPVEETPVLLWDIAIAWEISYNALYLAGRRGRIPVWRDERGRIHTTREAAERWYTARAPQVSLEDADPALPIREAASAVGVSRSTVSRGVARGLIPSEQNASGIRLVRVTDVRAYLKHAIPTRPYIPADTLSLVADGAGDGAHDGHGAPATDGAGDSALQRSERRRVLVSLLRDLGLRVGQQSKLLSYDLTQGDYTTIQNRALQIRQLSDTIEEVRIILDDWS